MWVTADRKAYSVAFFGSHYIGLSDILEFSYLSCFSISPDKEYYDRKTISGFPFAQSTADWVTALFLSSKIKKLCGFLLPFSPSFLNPVFLFSDGWSKLAFPFPYSKHSALALCWAEDAKLLLGTRQVTSSKTYQCLSLHTHIKGCFTPAVPYILYPFQLPW